jgi:RHS repeat-associated protein
MLTIMRSFDKGDDGLGRRAQKAVNGILGDSHDVLHLRPLRGHHDHPRPLGESLQFTGRENDGTGLYYHRARYYDPGRGRLVSEDPIELFGGDAR